MSRFHRLAALIGSLAVMLTMIAVAMPAEAAVRKWPRGNVSYFDATKDKAAVKAAVSAWNKSGVNVHFKKIKGRKKADIVIRNSKHVPAGCGTGLATLGYLGGRQGFVNILHGDDSGGQSCAQPGQTLVVTHELGHVLGLTHTDKRCSVMNTSHTNGVAPTQCIASDPATLAKPGRWWCRGPEQKDLKVLQKLYGGKPKAVPANPWCDAIDRIPASGPMTAAFDPSGNLNITITRAAEPPVPGWLGTYYYGAPGFEVHVTPGACTAVPGNDATLFTSDLWDVPVGAAQTTSSYKPLTPGVNCVSAWSFDQGSNYALAPATALVTVAARPATRAAEPWVDTAHRAPETPKVIRFD
ncbi:M57 family metalloprotease [Nocardioides sp. InS609-2]|uniref:M57 family metalloprotease n=1 Tax=Nocardioides sp. InS609-2 TaxID=2760705 RepID=UPI0020C11A80|nr:M57 family metalloprotease [Nocardioides sp. InS609-2]